MPDPQWQGLRPTGKTLDNGLPEPGRPIIINCAQSNPENCHEQTHAQTDKCPGLCVACTADFRLVLADVPLLLDDLDIAIAGETRFVEHGTRNGTTPTTSGGNQAIAAHQRLTAALINAADWPDVSHPEHIAQDLYDHLHLIAHLPETRHHALDISSAVSRAHKVIDAPPDLTYYGACPEGHDIWQERIHADSEAPVKCRCGYTSDLASHQKRLLDVGEDRWLTIGELVGAITSAGENVTRDQIKGWIEREGLAREKRVRPRYVKGELVTSEVWTYRLGDVRERAARGDQRKKVSA